MSTGEKYCAHGKHMVPVSAFPKNKSRKDGLHAYCLACNREKQAAERARRGEEYREMRRRYRASEKGRAAYGRYVPKHPWQKWAQSLVWREINAGRMTKPDACSECGDGGRIDGHHDDYAKPLEVRWLCRWCHQEWHRVNGEAANAGMHVITAANGIWTQRMRAKAERLPLVVALREAGKSQKEIAAQFGVTPATICNDLKSAIV